MPVADTNRSGVARPAAKPKKRATPSYGLKGGAAFGPMPGNATPLRKQVKAQHAQTRAATQRAVDHGMRPAIDLPSLPKLAHYSTGQRQAIRRLGNAATQKALKAQGSPRAQAQFIANIPTLANTADRGTRQQLHKLMAANANRDRAAGIKGPSPDKVAESVGVNTPHPKPKPHHFNFKGTTHIAGIPVPGLHQLGYTVHGALDGLTRPARFVSGAAHAVDEGKDPLKGGLENFKHPKYGFSDVFKERGVSPTAAAVLGLGSDIATDPLNLVSLGAAPVASHLLSEADHARTVAKEAESAGRLKDAAKFEAKADKLRAKAADAPTNRGVQVTFGIRHPLTGKRYGITTSGSSTAGLNKLLRGSDVARILHDSGPAQQVGRRLAATFRPADRTHAQHTTFLDIERRARGELARGQAAGERKGHALQNLMDGQDTRPLLQFMEGGHKPPTPTKPGEVPDLQHGPEYTHADLTPEQLQAFTHMSGDFDKFFKRESDLGLIGPEDYRPNYVPHVLTPKAEKNVANASRRGGKRNPFANARTIKGTVHEINDARDAKLFSEDPGHIYAERSAKHTVLVANRNFQSRVVNHIARPFKSLEDLKPGETVYRYGRQSGMHPVADGKLKLSPRDIAKAQQDLKPGGKEALVVLPRSIGDHAVRGVLPGRSIVNRDIVDLNTMRPLERFNSELKSLLTVFNAPSYQLRNFAGDTFNGRLAGTSASDQAQGLRVANWMRRRNVHERSGASLTHGAYEPNFMVSLGHGRKVPVKNLVDEMEVRGVTGHSFFGHDIAQHVDKTITDPRAYSRRFYRKGPEKIRSASQTAENVNRAATYIGARSRGLNPDEAAAFTLQHHFDYGQLTDYERNLLKKIAPFWTFTARNTPLQARSILKRPSVYANYGLAEDDARKEAKLDPGYYKNLPGYMQRQLPFVVNQGGHRRLLSPQLPINDLSRVQALTNGDLPEFSKETLQMVNPLAKALFELSQNHSTFFRAPIYQDAENPDAPHYVNAPWWVRAIPIPAVRTFLAGGNKEAAKQGLITSKADYFFRILPQLNTVNVVGQGSSTRSQSALDGILSQASGVKVNEYTPDKYKLQRLYDERNKVDGQRRDAKKLGQTAKQKQLSRRYGLLTKQIQKLGGTTPKKHKSALGGPALGNPLGGSSGLGNPLGGN